MAVREILLLGNPALYEVSEEIAKEELGYIGEIVQDLHDTLMDFRKKYHAGRAIAAPQIGIRKRLIYMNIDQPVVLINPEIVHKSTEMMKVWDDCMSFPDLLVQVWRHKECCIQFRNMNWEETYMDVEGDLSELLQHEYDHLDGILAASRAIDGRSFALKSQRSLLD